MCDYRPACCRIPPSQGWGDACDNPILWHIDARLCCEELWHTRLVGPINNTLGATRRNLRAKVRAVWNPDYSGAAPAYISNRRTSTGCDRTEAMRLATEEWRRDNR
jgi:hypothetical protein